MRTLWLVLYYTSVRILNSYPDIHKVEINHQKTVLIIAFSVFSCHNQPISAGILIVIKMSQESAQCLFNRLQVRKLQPHYIQQTDPLHCLQIMLVHKFYRFLRNNCHPFIDAICCKIEHFVQFWLFDSLFKWNHDYLMTLK